MNKWLGRDHADRTVVANEAVKSSFLILPSLQISQKPHVQVGLPLSDPLHESLPACAPGSIVVGRHL
jgi:hypothetical protein